MHTSETAVFYASNTPLRMERVAIPDLKPGEILVQNEYATLCRSDLNTICGKRTEPCPTILGHEVIGRIVKMGEGAPSTDLLGQPLAVGSRISWAIFSSDPASPLALKGIPQKGSGLVKYGHERITESSGLHGGLSQYIILRANTPIAALSEGLHPGVGAIINCAVATVAGAFRLAGDVHGRSLLVSGAGMLGMIACAMGKTLGADPVTAMDTQPERLALARDFGADATTLPGVEVAPLYEVVIELSGVAAAMENTLGLLTTGGVAVWVGATYPERNVQLAAEKIVRNLLTIRGLHNYNLDDFAAAVRFMENHCHDFPFESMIYDGFTLDTVNEAFAYGLSANPFRVGIRIS